MKTISVILAIFFLFPCCVGALDLNTDAKSIILMEQNTGSILYELNPDEALPPASVTKIMTLLLISEAIDSGKMSLTDNVTASAYAASMGGSQIYLKEGEVMTAEDMIKSIVIASANDAAVAMAEHIAGSESAFVTMMNDKAAALGMNNTHFENTNGLDDTAENHVTSARDIAIMSKELLKHTWILNYTTIWMDSVRDGQFGLTNTNRLIKNYKGANGLKTGSTAKAGFCISATAKREDMQLIAVVMGAKTRDSRNLCAAQVLDFGFANFEYYSLPSSTVCDIPLKGGEAEVITGVYLAFETVRLKNDSKIMVESVIFDDITAPVAKGQVVGQMVLNCDGNTIATLDITAEEDYGKIGYLGTLKLLFEKWILL